MPPLLSGNTLGLKFMQRGAAAKAAATEARKQEEAKKQNETKKQAVTKPELSSSENESDSSAGEDSSSEDEARQPPVASTSKLPARHQPSISTESSYLAFPILSSAYGVASTSEASGNVNGRFSFGQMPKKEKHRRVETDEEPSYSDEEGSRRQQTKSGAIGKKEKKIYSISSGGSGFQHKPSIREQQRAAAAEANRRRDSSAKFKSDDNDGVGDFKYEEDTSFVDDMMTQARQKRQLDASQNGRKKKQKSAV